jgi:hypothetical protein
MDPEPAVNATPSSWSYYVSSTYASDNPSFSDQGPRAWYAFEQAYSSS